MQNVLIVAPHPDDEVLGCGGTLLRLAAEGAATHWLIVTSQHEAAGFPRDRIEAREREIAAVAGRLRFASTARLDLPATRLDAVPLGEIVARMGAIVQAIQPDTLLLPFPGDAHSEHGIAFAAGAACTKSFRYPSVRRVLVYETLSETECGIDPARAPFRPNVFVDISSTLEEKIAAMRIYASEMGPFPFPRSEEAIRALAAVRGAACGSRAAEAFVLLKEVV